MHLWLEIALVLVAFSGLSDAGIAWGAPPEGAPRLLVKLRATGPEAITECAESLWREARSFHSAARSGSDAIDAFHARFRTRAVRALFRDSDGRSFAAQQEALARRGRQLAQSRAGRNDDFAPSSSSLELGRRMQGLAHVYRFELPPDTQLSAAMTVLRSAPGVEYVQADHTHSLDQVLDDPFLLSQGAWGQP